MQVNTMKLMKDFNKEIVEVKKMFKVWDIPGNLHDHYEIKVIDGSLKIILINKEQLPDAIANALLAAFDRSLLITDVKDMA